jgi:hypothetical protein
MIKSTRENRRDGILDIPARSRRAGNKKARRALYVAPALHNTKRGAAWVLVKADSDLA